MKKYTRFNFHQSCSLFIDTSSYTPKPLIPVQAHLRCRKAGVHDAQVDNQSFRPYVQGAKRLVQGRHQSPPIMPSQQHKTTVLGYGWEFALRYGTTCPYGAGGQTSKQDISGPCGNTLRRHRDTMEVPDHYIMQHSSTPSGIYAGIPTPQSNALGHRLPRRALMRRPTKML